WTTRDAVARLAVRSHLPSAERAHFGQYKTAQSLYDDVVARYSSPATTALSRLMLLYLFPDLAAFATVADLLTHLRTSDARYCAALPTENHFLSLCPTELTVDMLEERLTSAEKSIVAVGASRGDPLFEGCSPLPLLPSVSSAAVVDLVGTEEVGAASAPSGRRRNSKGKGGKGGGGDGGGGGGGGEGVAVEVGVVEGVGASVVAVGVVEAAAAAVEAAAAVVEVAAAVVLVEVQPHSVEALVVASASSSRVPVRPRQPSNFMSGTLGVGGLGAAALGASESAAPGTSESAALGTSQSAAPGAGESALSGTAPTEALHTFTLDSGASGSFFCDSTRLTPLTRHVAVSLADPSGGPVLAHASTVLPCPAAPSGLLSGLHFPSFSTNLVSGADLQDVWVDQFTPEAASGQVSAAASKSSPASAPYSCRPLSHETLLSHHRLGHPSLPRLRGMATRTLVSGLPRSLPPLPPGPAPTCVPCVEGWQRAAPHSSEFPPKEAPLQTLRMDVWGPARVRGQGHERYFLLVVDDYSRHTTVFPLRRKGEVTEGFCRAEGIRQTFRLPASPQQNGIAERRIGMVMDVARTSMIHAAAPRFLWPFAVQYAAHQINLQPRVPLPETTPTVRWRRKVGDAFVLRVWGSQSFVRDTSPDKLVLPCHSLRAPPVDPLPPQGPAPSGVSQVDPVEPLEVAVDSGAARGAEPAGAGPRGAEPRFSVSEGAEPGGAEPERVEPLGAERGGAESRV
ncbi:unnamed protein product, partial [Closterium sp. NIES-54]